MRNRIAKAEELRVNELLKIIYDYRDIKEGYDVTAPPKN